MLTLAAPASADTFGRMTSVDEASRDPGFAGFRADLAAAVSAMDTEAVLAVTAEDIDTGSLIDDYGADFGREALVAAWMPEALPPEQWDLWPVLGDILANGGRFVAPGRFCAPYFHTELPPALATDPNYRYGAITADRLTVYMHPTTATYELGQVAAGDIVQLLNPGGLDVADRDGASDLRFEAIWFGGRAAYVDTSQVRRLGGFYACFERDPTLDQWMMVAFGAPRGRE